MRQHEITAELSHSQTVHSGECRCFRVVHNEAWLHIDAHRQAVFLAELPGEHALARVGAHADQSVPAQVDDLLRPAMSGEVGRRGADQRRHGQKQSSDVLVLGQDAAADREIEAVRHEISEVVRELESQCQFRVHGEEVGQQREDVLPTERRGCSHSQRAADRLALLLKKRRRVRQRFDGARAAIEKTRPFGRKADLPRRPLEQPRAELVLKAADVLADRGRRDAQGARGSREAAATGCLNKGLDQPQVYAGTVKSRLQMMSMSLVF